MLIPVLFLLRIAWDDYCDDMTPDYTCTSWQTCLIHTIVLAFAMITLNILGMTVVLAYKFCHKQPTDETSEADDDIDLDYLNEDHQVRIPTLHRITRQARTQTRAQA